jgi:hypothetical protein
LLEQAATLAWPEPGSLGAARRGANVTSTDKAEPCSGRVCRSYMNVNWVLPACPIGFKQSERNLLLELFVCAREGYRE